MFSVVFALRSVIDAHVLLTAWFATCFFFFCVSFGGINFLNVFLWFLTFVNLFCCYGFYTRGLVA